MNDIAAYIQAQVILDGDPQTESDPIEAEYSRFNQMALNLHQERVKAYEALKRQRSGVYWDFVQQEIGRKRYEEDTNKLDAQITALLAERDIWLAEAKARDTEIRRYRWSINSPKKTYGPPDTIRAMILSAREQGIASEFDFPNVEIWVK